MHCADGVYECNLNIENGGLDITPVNQKPRSIQVDFTDDIFPGEGKLIEFLQERLSNRYRIGTHLTLNFQDRNVSYQIGLISSHSVE